MFARIQSGVALRFPPQSKTLARWFMVRFPPRFLVGDAFRVDSRTRPAVFGEATNLDCAAALPH
jgi:hypothetical protein